MQGQRLLMSGCLPQMHLDSLCRWNQNRKSKTSKKTENQAAARFSVWCGRWDLNPYVIQHTPLKRACLPIPALPHIHLALPHMLHGSNTIIIRRLTGIVNTRDEKSSQNAFSSNRNETKAGRKPSDRVQRKADCRRTVCGVY